MCQGRGRELVRLVGASKMPGKEVYLVVLGGINRNYVWSLDIFVMFVGLGGAKKWERCFKFIFWGWQVTKGAPVLIGRLSVYNTGILKL